MHCTAKHNPGPFHGAIATPMSPKENIDDALAYRHVATPTWTWLRPGEDKIGLCDCAVVSGHDQGTPFYQKSEVLSRSTYRARKSPTM